MYAVGWTQPTWRRKEANKARRKTAGVGGLLLDGWDRWMRHAHPHHIPGGSQPFRLRFCGFSERVIQNNPIFSLTALTPFGSSSVWFPRRFEYVQLSMMGLVFLILLSMAEKLESKCVRRAYEDKQVNQKTKQVFYGK